MDEISVLKLRPRPHSMRRDFVLAFRGLAGLALIQHILARSETLESPTPIVDEITYIDGANATRKVITRMRIESRFVA
jgi:hypothetical protein